MIEVTRAFDGVAARPRSPNVAERRHQDARRAGMPAPPKFCRRLSVSNSGSPGLQNIQPTPSGAVVEVAMSHYRVAGLSRFLKLGECVSFDVGDASRSARSSASTRLGHAQAVRRALRRRHRRQAFRAETLSLSPHEPGKARVIDALGAPIDSARRSSRASSVDAPDAAPPPAMRRARVKAPLRSGVRVIDFFTPLCAGQRIGIFAGSGVGKSSLLAMLHGRRPSTRS